MLDPFGEEGEDEGGNLRGVGVAEESVDQQLGMRKMTWGLVCCDEIFK